MVNIIAHLKRILVAMVKAVIGTARHTTHPALMAPGPNGSENNIGITTRGLVKSLFKNA